MTPVLGVGHCNLDYLGVVDRYPPVDRKQRLSSFAIQVGGPVPVALATLARFGRTTQLVAKVSDDEIGRRILAELGRLGVGVQGMVREAGRTSPFSFVAVERTTGRRNVFWSTGEIAALREADVAPGLVDGKAALLLDGHQAEPQLLLAKRARARGVPVLLDAGSRKPGMGELLRFVDYLVASEGFAAELAPGAEPEQALRTLRDLGPPVVVVTLGEEGCVGLWGEEVIRVPALPVEVVDTTGAGDVFHGAFLHGLLEAWPPPRVLRFANAAAGLKCRALGGPGGIPPLEEVGRYL